MGGFCTFQCASTETKAAASLYVLPACTQSRSRSVPRDRLGKVNGTTAKPSPFSQEARGLWLGIFIGIMGEFVTSEVKRM